MKPLRKIVQLCTGPDKDVYELWCLLAILFVTLPLVWVTR